MDDIKEIEKFLNKIKLSAKAGIPITSNMVYANLKYLGRRVVNKSHIDNNFSDWINSFQDTPNINVFVKDDWNYFCQFVNDDKHTITSYNMIKMYIPIDDQHINEVAKRIFNFMVQNNIIHHSKIGSEVRFDDIVVRIGSKEDAKLIETFVMNDPYIKEGLMKPNPFAFNNGYISYAWDGELSFNTVVAAYISNYINELNDNNRLDDTSYKGFVAYVAKVYEAVFKEDKYKDEYITNMEVEEEYQLDNYQKVTGLLLQSMMPDKKEKDFYSIYNNVVSNNENKEDDIKVYISDRDKKEWEKIYTTLISKYGYEEADERIFLFLETNNYHYFTRDNGIRKYLMNNNITTRMVRELYLSMPRSKENRDVLADAAKNTYEKYGYTQVYVALDNVRLGTYEYLTNQYGDREKMKKQVNPQQIYGLIVGYYLENGYDIKDIPKDNGELYSQYISLLQEKENSKNRR